MDSETSILKQNGQKEPENPGPHSEKGGSDKGWYKKWLKKWKDMTLANKLMVTFSALW